MSARILKVECSSGDGTALQVNTEAQAEDSALRFEIGGLSVWVDRFDLGDLIGFLEVEQRRYETDWPYDPAEDDEPERTPE